MASKAYARLRAVANRQTLRLTHYGRKSGRPYEVVIWYLVDGDRLYLVTANANRNWVRNVRLRPGVSMRIGDEIFNGDVRPIVDQQEREKVNRLVERKYWYVVPMLRLGRLLAAVGVMRDNSEGFEVILAEE
ncbi:MAG TPA: nitroreductase family deazaflavin-dependent oxidoreductase [Candidatus Acidoferrales bacterium]|nr:nitroreductase family deazaflavin-dependent oxidoreductase [Candidatus Acidoferrales bacterium]